MLKIMKKALAFEKLNVKVEKRFNSTDSNKTKNVFLKTLLKTNFQSVIAEVGDSLGLFLGLSLYDIVEYFVNVSQKMYEKVGI